MMGMWKCQHCGIEQPDFDVAHVCDVALAYVNKPIVTVEDKKPKMWELGVMIHGYRLRQTCSACPEQYDVFDDLGQQVAYFRLRHGGFRVNVPDHGGEEIYHANPEGDGIFMDAERVRYLTEAVLAVQEYYINRRWDKHSWLDTLLDE